MQMPDFPDVLVEDGRTGTKDYWPKYLTVFELLLQPAVYPS